jgi:hypothetical protein
MDRDLESILQLAMPAYSSCLAQLPLQPVRSTTQAHYSYFKNQCQDQNVECRMALQAKSAKPCRRTKRPIGVKRYRAVSPCHRIVICSVVPATGPRLDSVSIVWPCLEVDIGAETCCKSRGRKPQEG